MGRARLRVSMSHAPRDSTRDDDVRFASQSVDVSSKPRVHPSQNAPKTIFDYPIVHRLLRLEPRFAFGSSTPEDAVADVIQAFKFGRQAYDRTTDSAADPNHESTRDHYALWLRRFYSMRTRFETPPRRSRTGRRCPGGRPTTISSTTSRTRGSDHPWTDTHRYPL